MPTLHGDEPDFPRRRAQQRRGSRWRSVQRAGLNDSRLPHLAVLAFAYLGDIARARYLVDQSDASSDLTVMRSSRLGFAEGVIDAWQLRRPDDHDGRVAATAGGERGGEPESKRSVLGALVDLGQQRGDCGGGHRGGRGPTRAGAARTPHPTRQGCQ